MDSASASADALRRQIVIAEEELGKLKEQLANIEIKDVSEPLVSLTAMQTRDVGPVTQGKWPLIPEEYQRYGRQMIVPHIGIEGNLYLPLLSEID